MGDNDQPDGQRGSVEDAWNFVQPTERSADPVGRVSPRESEFIGLGQSHVTSPDAEATMTTSDWIVVSHAELSGQQLEYETFVLVRPGNSRASRHLDDYPVTLTRGETQVNRFTHESGGTDGRNGMAGALSDPAVQWVRQATYPCEPVSEICPQIRPLVPVSADDDAGIIEAFAEEVIGVGTDSLTDQWAAREDVIEETTDIAHSQINAVLASYVVTQLG